MYDGKPCTDYHMKRELLSTKAERRTDELVLVVLRYRDLRLK